MSALRVVIVGGGFGGLFATRALARAAVNVVLIDQRNYHLFRPMLYQGALPAYCLRIKFPRPCGQSSVASAMSRFCRMKSPRLTRLSDWFTCDNINYLMIPHPRYRDSIQLLRT